MQINKKNHPVVTYIDHKHYSLLISAYQEFSKNIKFYRLLC